MKKYDYIIVGSGLFLFVSGRGNDFADADRCCINSLFGSVR